MPRRIRYIHILFYFATPLIEDEQKRPINNFKASVALIKPNSEEFQVLFFVEILFIFYFFLEKRKKG
jgi:hypothetical protein